MAMAAEEAQTITSARLPSDNLQEPVLQRSKTGRLSLRVPACASDPSDEKVLAKLEIVSMPWNPAKKTRSKKETRRMPQSPPPSLVDRGMSSTRTGFLLSFCRICSRTFLNISSSSKPSTA